MKLIVGLNLYALFILPALLTYRNEDLDDLPINSRPEKQIIPMALLQGVLGQNDFWPRCLVIAYSD